MKKKIWFNRWFNNAFYFINLIKEGDTEKEFEIYGSHPNRKTIVSLACDYFEIEPEISGEAYVNYCLDFCKRHKIDVFIPNCGLVDMSENIKSFEALGTKVMVSPDFEFMKIITNKGRFYELCKEKGIFNIPEYYIVNNLEQFKEAYSSIIDNGNKVCIKPLNSDGGSGFRVIDDRATSLKNLLGDLNHKVSFEETCKIMRMQESFEDIMVMEYLESFEYSIDCLAHNGKLLAAIPRKKIDSRVRALQEIPKFVELARLTEEIFKIPYIFNIQLKYSKGVPKLLEINPRMSGGLNATCLCGINFPYLAVKLILGEAVEIPEPKLDIYSTKIEQRFIIDYKKLLKSEE